MILEDDDLITSSWLPRGITPEARFTAPPQEDVSTSQAAAQKAANTSLDEPFNLPPEGVQLESGDEPGRTGDAAERRQSNAGR